MKYWRYDIGDSPYKVTAHEKVEKRGVIYLRWRHRGNWKHRSLGKRIRKPSGAIIPAVEQWAKEQAQAKYADLLTRKGESDPQPTPMTLREGFRLAISSNGKYPADTAHRREVIRELEYACLILGDSTPFTTIKRAHFRQLWRAKIQELQAKGRQGLRGAEITVSRLLAVASWLRDEEKIPSTACVLPRTWKYEVAKDWRLFTGAESDYSPNRPRYTLEEFRTLIDVAPKIDPRFGLLLALGAELRLGQVRRAWRSDLDIEAAKFVVRGTGKKRGATVFLTEEQVAAVREAIGTGYLRVLEELGPDYRLFPRGKIRGSSKGDPVATMTMSDRGPVGPTATLKWILKAEKLAGIQHVKGRATYGLRRQGVDAADAEGISADGLKELGGWADKQIPDKIYRSRDRTKAAEEARDVRRRLRGEGSERNPKRNPPEFSGYAETGK